MPARAPRRCAVGRRIAERETDDPIEVALETMASHQVRRLPVIDGHDLVGIVSQADIARNHDGDRVGDLVEAISR